MRWARHLARITNDNAYKILFGKSERKRPLGTPRHRWEDIIKMYLMLGRCGLDACGTG
jgi:hypothetical protein